MLCYKIVKVEDEKLVSPYASSASIEYKEGEIVKPKFGRIFVFKRLGDAITFANSDLSFGSYFIYLCECGELIEQKFNCNYQGEYEDFWKSEQEQYWPYRFNISDLNAQTTDWLKLLKRIDIEYYYSFCDIEGVQVNLE